MPGAMPFDNLPCAIRPMPGAVPLWCGTIEPAQLREACAAVATQGGRLAALWGSDERDGALGNAGFALHVALAASEGMLWLTAPLPAEAPEYPDLSDLYPCAARMQRATRDLLGIRSAAQDLAAGGTDCRSWLRHGAWPEEAFPLRRDADAARSFTAGDNRYPFVPVEGEGVHEIPVGPVHAGTIEPGHFRFSIVGEKILRLEAHLGYKHKGIEKRFEQLTLAEGARLAGRISGDSTVAYAWAYAMAVEAMAGVTPPPRALWLRALLLERERIANHLGDLGFLGNDGGLAFGLSQFMRLKEDVLRLHERFCGHRYLMDLVIPGGVARDLERGALGELAAQCDALESEVRVLRGIYDEHAGLQDRFITCGRLTPDLAERLGVIGLAGRASGQGWDARAKPGYAPYDLIGTKVVTHGNGDVAARATVRFEEIFESLRLIRAILERIEPGGVLAVLPPPPAGGRGLGWVEGWRGEVLVAIEAGAESAPRRDEDAYAGTGIRRCHVHDPSWQNWPAIEHAVIGNIVPDFPLINKSFNLSYSGPDL